MAKSQEITIVTFTIECMADDDYQPQVYQGKVPLTFLALEYQGDYAKHEITDDANGGSIAYWNNEDDEEPGDLNVQVHYTIVQPTPKGA